MPMTSLPCRRKDTAAAEMTALAAGAGPPANRIATLLGHDSTSFNCRGYGSENRRLHGRPRDPSKSAAQDALRCTRRKRDSGTANAHILMNLGRLGRGRGGSPNASETTGCIRQTKDRSAAERRKAADKSGAVPERAKASRDRWNSCDRKCHGLAALLSRAPCAWSASSQHPAPGL